MAFIGKNPKFNTGTLTPQSAQPSNPVEGMIYYDDGTTNTEGVYKYQNGAWEFIGTLVDHLKLNPLAADPTSPVDGQIFYSDGTARAEGLWEYNNGAWQRVGGQNSDLSVIKQFDAEDQDLTGFTNVAVSSSSPINGEYSYTISTFPANFPAVTIADRNKNKVNSVELHATMTSGTAKFVVRDQSANVLDEQEFSSTGIQKVILTPYVNDTVTSLDFRIEDVSSATGLKIDDIIMSDNPFTYKNLTETEHARFNTITGFGSTNTVIPYFTNEVVNTTGGIVTIDNDSTNGLSITANRDCTVDFSYSTDSSGFGAPGASINSSELTTDVFSITTADRVLLSIQPTGGSTISASTTVFLEAGDVLRPHGRGLGIGTASRYHLNVVATAEAEHVITPAKSTLTDWTEFTPTASAGFGTITNAEGEWRRVGDSMEVRGFFTTGTLAASVAEIDLPSGFNIDVDKLTSTGSRFCVGEIKRIDAGTTTNTSSNTSNLHCDGTNTDKLFMSTHSLSDTALDKDNVTAMLISAGESVYFQFTVPITGWDAQATFLAAIPKPLTAYVKDLKSAGTAGGTFTSGSWQTRDLNTVDGDSGIVSLSSNQITLQPGTYKITAWGCHHIVEGNIMRLQNITDASTEILGMMNDDNGNSGGINHLAGKFTITSAKTFELQHRCETTRSGDGFGESINLGVDNQFAMVEITKEIL